jgi:hypothetical protein
MPEQIDGNKNNGNKKKVEHPHRVAGMSYCNFNGKKAYALMLFAAV